MSDLEFSEQLNDSFKNITSFFKEISILLKDCDRLMSENGYTTFNGNLAAYQMSKSLLNPEGWIPTYLSRAYVNEEKLEDKSFDDIKFVSIFLRYGIAGTHNVEMEGDEPLIVAGMLIPNNPNNFKFDAWHTKIWFWKLDYEDDEEDKWVNSNAKADGTVVELKTTNPEEWWGNNELRTFAYPLEDMKNTGDLKERIIDKLIEMDERYD